MIAKIHLLGTGGGWGESVIIDLGNGEYIVVDSCIDPNNKKSLPINFLTDNSIPFDKIVLIVCTHWHDDHIRGISELLEICYSAAFCFAKVSDLKKFFRLLSIDYKKADKNISNSSTKEFNKCIEILDSRSSKPIPAGPNRVIYSNSLSDLKIEVRTISPSDYSIELFDHELSKLITEFGNPNKSIVIQKPNDRSVALYLVLGKHKVILGADLEINPDSRLGWGAVISNTNLVKLEKANYFKIPHHGSENGYSPEIWEKLLTLMPESSLTPYNKGLKLPTQKMVKQYLVHTNRLHITSNLTLSSKPKKREQNIEKVIANFSKNLSEIRYSYGIISSEIDISDDNDNWKTTLSGAEESLK